MIDKICRKVLGLWVILRSAIVLRKVRKGPKVRVHGALSVYGGERISIGAGTCFHRGKNESELTAHEGGSIQIGQKCSINSLCVINASGSITIGDRCLLGYGVMIFDSALHGEAVEARNQRPPAKPVVIDDDVWIGSRAIILAGVKIGAGSIVAAGSLVTKDVPPLTIVAGNPARVVRAVSDGESRTSFRENNGADASILNFQR